MASTGVSVIIPCLNEVDSIADVVSTAHSALCEMECTHEILVIDNGSTDDSPAEAKAAGARVVHEATRGYGAALRRGLREAQYELLVMADGDGTYDFSELAGMIRPLQKNQADMVIGNRMRQLDRGAMPFLHRLGNPLLTGILNVLMGRRTVRDAHCGFRAIRADAYARLGCVTTGMEFASEMVVKAVHANLRIEQIDIRYRVRTGSSKLRTLHDGWRHLRFMLLHAPTAAFLIPGLLVWILTLLAAIKLAFLPFEFSADTLGLAELLVVAVLNLISLQVLLTGMLAKAHAHVAGIRSDDWVAWLYEHFTLERALAVAVVVMVAGFGLAAIQISFGGSSPTTSQLSRMTFGVLVLLNGVQTLTSSYLISILALPQRSDEPSPS